MPKSPKAAAAARTRKGKLTAWRELQELSIDQLLDRIAKALPRGVRCIDRTTLWRMETGQIRRPNPTVVATIVRLTGGAVGFEDLMLPPAARKAQPRGATRRAS